MIKAWERGYTVLAQGLTLLSLMKVTEQAVNIWPTSLFLTSRANYVELRETIPAY